MFKMQIKEDVEKRVVGALHFKKADNPEHIGRFNGILNNQNVSVWPNHYKTKAEQPDWLIKTNKEGGYKPLGELFFDEVSQTLKGTVEGLKIEIVKNKKPKTSKSPQWLIIGGAV
ncbi:MAG: hypothetical protein ACRCU6_04295 [Fusobacteriaceae bacterium]